tara:strand:- start:8146 stop:8277 length:132 start_codon:yes stop_codon:yes gene_type:complete
MIKKISLILILITFTVSCGKKDDPKYKESVDRKIIHSTHIKIS